MKFKLVLVFLVISMVAGCTTPLLMVPSSSPSNGRAFEVLGPTEGESCYANILGIPLSRDASLHTAVKEAKLKLNAEALVDVVVDSWSLYTFFFNKQCTIVHARGIRFTGQPAPYLEPKSAVPPVPPAPPKEEAAPPVPEKEEAKAKVPAQPKEKKKSKKELARERRKAERERKKAEREAKKQAALEKKPTAEEEKKRKAEAKKKAAEEKKSKAELAKKKAEEKKKKALEKRRAEEEAKPVPDQYKIFCKYKKGTHVRVETKTQVIEAEFLKCMYFGIRVKQKDKGIGVIPFEQIWMVKKIVPPPPKAEPAKPAAPGGAQPSSKSEGKAPAKPEKPSKPAKP